MVDKYFMTDLLHNTKFCESMDMPVITTYNNLAVEKQQLSLNILDSFSLEQKNMVNKLNELGESHQQLLVDALGPFNLEQKNMVNKLNDICEYNHHQQLLIDTLIPFSQEQKNILNKLDSLSETHQKYEILLNNLNNLCNKIFTTINDVQEKLSQYDIESNNDPDTETVEPNITESTDVENEYTEE